MRFSVPAERGLLTTRSEGERLRQKLEKALRPRPTDLDVSFSDVKALTISFADEFLGRVLTELQVAPHEPIPIVLTGLNEDAAEELDVVLERRKLAAASEVGGRLTLIGGDRYLKSTYEAAVTLRRFTPAALAEKLGSTVQNINNRLKKLVQAGALERSRVPVAGGGREYEYYIPEAFSVAQPA